MKLPLLGIIAVVCLQLGFTALNAIDRPIESLVAIKAVTTGTNPVAATFEPATDLISGVSEQVKATRRSSSGDVVTSAAIFRQNPQNVQPSFVHIKKNTNSRKLRDKSQLSAGYEPFRSTLITYPRVIRAENDSDNYRITTAAVRAAAPEKKSFASKTVSILKKPYKWIKALGSKF